jgi:hypothetical protein
VGLLKIKEDDMSFFGNILEKLGLRKSSAQTTKAKPPASQNSGAGASAARQGGATPQSSPRPQGSTAAGSARAPTGTGGTAGPSRGAAATAPAVAMVDVVGHLEELAASNPQKLNWRTSIVDLLKLLDIDSSPEARKELADELGAPADLKDGSVEMNMWLHRTVLRKIAENGGNVPKELLE